MPYAIHLPDLYVCLSVSHVLGGSLQSLDLALSYYIQFSIAFTAHKHHPNKDISSYRHKILYISTIP